MSAFSGKCDVYDSLIMIGQMSDNSDWSKVNIYHNGVLLDIKSVKDLAPYFPYVPYLELWHAKTGTIYLPEKSYIDQEEKESIEFKSKEMQRIYRRCKRKKEDFIPDEVVAAFPYGKDVYLEVAKRVLEHPTKPRLDGIHTAIAEMYREEWYDELVSLGYSEEEAKQIVYKNRTT